MAQDPRRTYADYEAVVDDLLVLQASLRGERGDRATAAARDRGRADAGLPNAASVAPILHRLAVVRGELATATDEPVVGTDAPVVATNGAAARADDPARDDGSLAAILARVEDLRRGLEGVIERLDETSEALSDAGDPRPAP
jgi:hypothetical protein